MASRLPTPGSDDGTWGAILNDFLVQAHNTDGTLKPISQSQVQNLTTDLSSKVSASDLDTSASTLINNTSSTTNGALKAAFQARQFPAWAGSSRTKSFDAFQSLYNPESATLSKIRARVNNALLGIEKRQIIAMGHSYMAGSNATPGVNDVISDVRALLSSAYPGAYVPRGISAFRNGEARDSHYSSVSAGWGTSNGVVVTLYATSTTSGDSLLYTSTETGTIVKIYVTADSTDFTYSIDGGAAVPVTTGAGDPLAVRPLIITGLANTTHAVSIIKTSTGPTRLIGCGVTSTVGLEVFNFGYGGSQSSQWIDLTPGEKRSVATSTVSQRDVVLLEMDTNDARSRAGNLSGPAWKANFGQIVASHVGLGHPTVIILSIDAPGSVPDITPARWNEYGLAAYELADQYDVPLFDMRFLFQSWASAGAVPYQGDSLHLNRAGWMLVARALTRMLTGS